jgi:hypothetical protein
MKFLNMSWEEKSTWVSLLILLFVFTGYFSHVFEGLATDSLNKVEATGLFIGAVISVVVLQIALHIVVAIFNVKDADRPMDERDRLFSIKAGNVSGLVLGVAVLTIASHAFLVEPSGLLVANLLLFAVFISQIVSYVLQLFYHRRGY